MPKKKWLREFTLSAARGRNIHPEFREFVGVLSPESRRVTKFKRGVPVFSETVDTIRNVATGNRQYKPPSRQSPLLVDYDEATFHETRSKFQFHLSGSFPRGGVSFESELYRVASDLSLVGFIKARSQYAIGHLQGDSFSLSYMRKWLEDYCNDEGVIHKVHLFNDSFGIPEFRYSKLECIKDWRSPVRRRQHMEVLNEEARLVKLSDKTRSRQDRMDSLGG